MATHPQKIIDAHCHIGEIPPWKFYDLEHPVKPTVYDYADTKAFVKNHMDEFKIERALCMSNYGVPIHQLSFDLNDVVMDAATSNDRILAAIKPGDVLLVSFGHNDEKAEDPARYTEPWSTFQDYLRLYLDGARAARAHPILVTPVERRRFTVDGVPYLSHGEYPDAMRALATATRTPLIDLTALSFAHWSALGPEATKEYFLWLDAGESPNYPAGVADNTHFQAHGAIEVARLVVSAGRTLPDRDCRALRNPSIPDTVLTWPPTRPAES